MDFNEIIKKAMAQGMSAEDVAKQFTEAMNEATKVDVAKKFCEKVYKTTGIHPNTVTMNQAIDILLGTMVKGKDLEEKDIKDMQNTLRECVRIADGIIGKNDDEVLDFMLKEIGNLFS